MYEAKRAKRLPECATHTARSTVGAAVEEHTAPLAPSSEKDRNRVIGRVYALGLLKSTHILSAGLTHHVGVHLIFLPFSCQKVT